MLKTKLKGKKCRIKILKKIRAFVLCLCICILAYLCIYVFVYLCICVCSTCLGWGQADPLVIN